MQGGLHRSAAEQIEYWTMLDRQASGVLDPNKLLDVLSELAAVRVEPVTTSAVAPKQPFAALEQQRCATKPQQHSRASWKRWQLPAGTISPWSVCAPRRKRATMKRPN